MKRMEDEQGGSNGVAVLPRPTFPLFCSHTRTQANTECTSGKFYRTKLSGLSLLGGSISCLTGAGDGGMKCCATCEARQTNATIPAA